MAISASMVKELREKTGAGMMDCKKALTNTDGDMDKAVEWLRENGLAKAEKKAGRIAAEGIVKTNISEDGKKAAIVEVNSETDFVAKNEKFQDFVAAVADQVNASSAADIDAFLAEPWAGDSSKTVKEELASMVATIGENMNIRRFEKDNTGAEVVECLKNVAMQIAAMNPQYLSSDDVSDEYKEREKAVLLAQAKNDPKNANKPDNIIEKMIIGRLNKELKEVCLTEQVYVKAENKETVAKYVESVAKAVGCNLTLKSFVRFETGEGLEKKEEDFAAEVAAQMGN